MWWNCFLKTLLWSILLLVRPTIGTPEGRPFHVICSSGTIGLLVDDPTAVMTTDGQRVHRIFASRHQRDASCTYSVVEPNAALRFELPYTAAECGVVSRRLSHPVSGLEHTLRLVLSYSPTELTENDRAFTLRCRYFVGRPTAREAREFHLFAETELSTIVPMPIATATATDVLGTALNLTTVPDTVGDAVRRAPTIRVAATAMTAAAAALDVSAQPQRDDVALAPRCDYTLHLDSLDGPVAESATLGEKVFHRWQCDGDAFALKVYECAVHDGGAQRYPLVDRHGCPTDASILPRVFYAADRPGLAYAPSIVFRFSNASRLFFNCLMYICRKRDPDCRQAVRPRCGNVRGSRPRRTRRNVIWRERTASLPREPAGFVNVQSTRRATTPLAGHAIVSYDIRPASLSRDTAAVASDGADGVLYDETFAEVANEASHPHLVNGGRRKLLGTTSNAAAASGGGGSFGFLPSIVPYMSRPSENDILDGPAQDEQETPEHDETGPSHDDKLNAALAETVAAKNVQTQLANRSYSPWSVRLTKITNSVPLERQNFGEIHAKDGKNDTVIAETEEREKSPKNSGISKVQLSFPTFSADGPNTIMPSFPIERDPTEETVALTSSSPPASSTRIPTAPMTSPTESNPTDSSGDNGDGGDLAWMATRIRVRPSGRSTTAMPFVDVSQTAASTTQEYSTIGDFQRFSMSKRQPTSTVMPEFSKGSEETRKSKEPADFGATTENLDMTSLSSDKIASSNRWADIAPDPVVRRQRLEEILLRPVAFDMSGANCSEAREAHARQLLSLRRTVIVLSTACFVAVCVAIGAVGVAFRRHLRARFALHDAIRLD